MQSEILRKIEMSESTEKLKAEIKFKHRVEGEVYERVMRVIRHGRQYTNPEEIYDAIFGHPNVQITMNRRDGPR